MTTNIQDAIMLLGDSITQFGFASNGFAARLAECGTDAYIRKMDVINRGFSGYNTDWIQPVFEQCFATQHDQQHAQKVRLLTIWFGANDAALPHSPQHVPLERYKTNLAKLIWAVRSPESPQYSPDTLILLMTPPPVDPEWWARSLAGLMQSETVDAPDRSLEASKRYAEAAREVGVKEGVAVVDVWTRIWEAAGGKEAGLKEFLSDGLHLSEKGYAVVYEGLIAAIAEKYPEYHYDNLRTVFATIDEIFQDPRNYLEYTKKRSAFPS
ncbi:SGNH hydrolase [Pilatotrama ljubarskyi]|nr:SGNH hydrolase [Pilatotrama ljubarskyi]